MKNKITFSKIVLFVFVLTVGVLFALTIKGNRASISNKSYYETAPGNPLEGSNSSSRFALTKSLSERGSFYLSVDEARLASPDVAKHNGKYISLFMPGVSILGVPFYMLGSYFNQPQIGAYTMNLILSLLNILFVYKISFQLSQRKIYSLIAAFCFVFATNTWAYSLGFTQHNFSVFVILLSLFCAMGKTNSLNNIVIGLMFGLGLMIDFPNAILLMPVIIYQLSRSINLPDKRVDYKFLYMAVGLIPILTFFFFYNIQTAGSPFSAAQFLGRTTDFHTQESIIQTPKDLSTPRKGIQLPFKTRHFIQGLTVLLASNERGWLYYSPLIAICLIGLAVAIKKDSTSPIHKVVVSMIGLNILTYSMFGDPWGGWSFGPRYLIPATALIFIYLPFYFDLKINKYMLATIFLVLAAYSVNLSSLGALTTSNIPPKQEAEHLITPIPYTPELNKQFIKTQTSSLFYNVNLSSKMKPDQYQQLIFALTLTFIILITGYAVHKQDKN